MDFFQSINWMTVLNCFIVGGILCVIGQILIDKTKLKPTALYPHRYWLFLGAQNQ